MSDLIFITDDTLTVDLEDGRTISVPIGWFPRLTHGTPAERANFQISGAGRGIHYRLLDSGRGVEVWQPLALHSVTAIAV